MLRAQNCAQVTGSSWPASGTLSDMPLLHIRVVSPTRLSSQVETILSRQPGATNIVVLPRAARSPSGDLFQADLARECVQQVVSELRELGIDRDGSISWDAVDTAIGDGMRQAER